MQRCKNAKFFMKSNGDVTYLDGWGMSIATQRAKEHENRTPGAKVMAETVKLGALKLGGAEVPFGRAVVPLVELSGSTAWWGGSTAPVGKIRRTGSGRILGRKRMILRRKFERFRGWKEEKIGEMLDPIETKQIYGSNPTKLRQTNKSQKKFGLFLVGIFGFRTKTTKSS